jgi:hypothetical protein
MHYFTTFVVKIRVLSEYKSSLKRQILCMVQHKNTIFKHNLHGTEMQFSDFCCDNGSPDGTDVRAGLTARMVYQRHVGGFLAFPVCGVWFSLQDLRFFPTYSVASFAHMLG